MIGSVNYVFRTGSVTSTIICRNAAFLLINKRHIFLRTWSGVRVPLVLDTKDLPTLFKLSKLCKEILSTFKVIYKHI